MTITIKGRFPGMNEIIEAAKKHFHIYSDMKKNFTNIVAWSAKCYKPPDSYPVDIIITWYEPNLKRDYDNIMAGQKFILDGLVVAGVLKNDTQKYINSITNKLAVDRVNPRVEIILEEVEK